MDTLAAILAEGVGELLLGRGGYVSRRLKARARQSIKTNLECVQLDIGVAMSKTLNQALDNLLGPIRFRRHLVAHLDDGTPVLRRQVLVRRLGYNMVSP